MHCIKINALSTVYLFISEEKRQGVEVFHVKDLEKIYFEIFLEHGIQYESDTSRCTSLLVSNNNVLEKSNIGSKVKICFTAYADKIFKDMIDHSIITHYMRGAIPLRKLTVEKKNSFNGTFDIDSQLKSISIQLLTLVNMLIEALLVLQLIEILYQLPNSFFQTSNR